MPRRIREHLRAFWRAIEPGVDIDPDNSIERWDGQGEGRATAISFEGLGLTLFFVIGRTPPVRP